MSQCLRQDNTFTFENALNDERYFNLSLTRNNNDKNYKNIITKQINNQSICGQRQK